MEVELVVGDWGLGLKRMSQCIFWSRYELQGV